MTPQFSYEKKWKYLSFALMGIIATGVLAPRAFAANPTLEEVLATVMGIEAKTDNLPTDPASETTVNTRASQASVNTLQADVNTIKGSEFNTLKCNAPLRSNVDLSGCFLAEGKFENAQLRFANLRNAQLQFAHLNNADLVFADLRGANLAFTNFTGAQIFGAHFEGCTGTPTGISPNPCTP